MNGGKDPKAYVLVIEYIKTLFQQGEITFGKKLPSERTLMATLGLSRNSVREALRSLENMGIIESRHGQGNFLVDNMGKSFGSMLSLLLFVEKCSVAEINQLRRSIEIGACLYAVSKTQDSEIQALGISLSKLKNSLPEERASLDKEFHDNIIALSGNRLMQLINETLSQLFENTIQEILAHISQTEWEMLLSYHSRIYEALLCRKEADCITAVMGHYDFIEGVDN